MNPSEINKISSISKQPPVGLPNPVPNPKPVTPARVDFNRANPINNPPPAIKPQPNQPVDSGFSLINFSKSKIAKNDNLYQKNFRYKTRNALKGTLRSYADREKVANLLWDKRGYGGITKDEVKFGLRKLESQGKLRSDQVRAVRRKLGVY